MKMRPGCGACVCVYFFVESVSDEACMQVGDCESVEHVMEWLQSKEVAVNASGTGCYVSAPDGSRLRLFLGPLADFFGFK
eukprot:1098303-Pelagomonas_calceolata.AAC.1